MEVVARAVKVLAELAAADDDATAARAKQALESLSQPRLTAVADHAASALLRVRALEHDRAVKRLEELGATFGTDTTRLVAPGASHVVLRKDWRGGDEGLAWLRPLRDLKYLSLYGAGVTDAAVAHIQPLEDVTRIELYGTKISNAGVETLRKALPFTEIEFRRGALLGVTGSVTALDCRFTDVRAGSAADKAGLQVNDLVLCADGKPVSDFRSLTDVISTKTGGDHLKLEIQRDGKSLTVDVVLGEWE